jgi:DNA-binding XRE family transcriptional regulator
MCAILCRMFLSTQHSMPKRKQESKDLILRERKIFARNFKRARLEAGLTQSDITKITGLTQPYLSDVENAKETTSLDNANLLADAVGQSLSQLLTPAKK